jgi:hypothetical protein
LSSLLQIWLTLSPIRRPRPPHPDVDGEPGSLLGLVDGDDEEVGRAAELGAAAIVGLAAGVALGEYLGRPLSSGRDRFGRRVRRRATTSD